MSKDQKVFISYKYVVLKAASIIFTFNFKYVYFRDLERYKELEQRVKRRIKCGDQRGYGDLEELITETGNQHALATPTLGTFSA